MPAAKRVRTASTDDWEALQLRFRWPHQSEYELIRPVVLFELGNPVLQKEGYVTLIDATLAGAVLVGLALNALFGWWWADPLAGLVIVYYGLKEGGVALHEAA